MKKFSITKVAGRVVAVAGVAVLASPAFAAAGDIDTSPATLALTAVGAALAVVGAAYVSMRYAAGVWKWLTKFAG